MIYTKEKKETPKISEDEQYRILGGVRCDLIHGLVAIIQSPLGQPSLCNLHTCQ